MVVGTGRRIPQKNSILRGLKAITSYHLVLSVQQKIWARLSLPVDAVHEVITYNGFPFIGVNNIQKRDKNRSNP